jgi:transposase
MTIVAGAYVAPSRCELATIDGRKNLFGRWELGGACLRATSCEAITEAPAPSHPIPRGFAGPSLLAMVLVSKFLPHQPLNSSEQDLCPRGDRDRCLDAGRSGRCLRGDARPDDTTVPVLAKLKAVVGRIWTYVRDDRPFGGRDPPAALFYG